MPPPPDIVRSAYAELYVTSLAEARRWWVDLLGFVVTYEDPARCNLRGYDELTHHNRCCAPGAGGRPGDAGVPGPGTAEDLARAEAFYGALGCRTERVPPGVTRGVRRAGCGAEDPLGSPCRSSASIR